MSNPALQDFAVYNSIPDYLQRSYVGQIIRYSPGTGGGAPLFALTSLMAKSKPCYNVEHGYFSKTQVFPAATLTAAVADGSATTFTVASTSNIIKGDLLQASTTKEIVRVVTVNSGTSLAVTRAFGVIAAGAIANSAVLHKVGTAFEQASARPASRIINPVRTLNYTQIFRNTWAIPGTMAAINTTVGMGNAGESKEDAQIFHAQDIETALLFGQRFQGTADGQFISAMDGIVESVRRLAPGANTTTAGATTNYDQLETAFDPMFNTNGGGKSGNVRTAFCGGEAIKIINKIGRLSGQYQLVNGQTSFGLSFNQIRLSRGIINLVEHPIMNTNTTWGRMAIAVDIPSLALCYLPGRQQVWGTYDKDRGFTLGEDSQGNDILSELTLENLNPAAHAVIHGLTAAA